MKIGILETGLLREQLTDRFDPYPIMFEQFLNLSAGALETEGFSVIRGEMPASIFECDGWLITGSRHGVYENLDWMIELQSFIRELAASHIPLVGICFGHQIIAQALGGEVVKSDKGWALGLHHYEIDKNHSWMESEPETVGLYAFHQDQVVTIPDKAEVFASSEFCPYAGLSYGESIISLQAHPEFEEAYEIALLDLFSGNLFSTELADDAYASMSDGRKADQARVSRWLSNFFLMSKTTSAASNS